MSEREQDALLDQIEQRRRWRALRSRVSAALLCIAAVAILGLLAMAR